MADLFLSTEEMEIECPELYGISSPLKAYKLAWQIHNTKAFSIQKAEDLVNYNDGGFHTCYEITEIDNGTCLMLTRNRGTKGFLYKKYKHIDYIICSIAADLSMDNDSITLIKQIEGVSLCLRLDDATKPDNMNFVQLL